MSHDVVIVGSGPNELVAACTLAAEKKSVLVVDPGPAVGGTARLEEIAPGFRVETCGASSGWLAPKIARDLNLAAHGWDPLVPEATTFTVGADGRSLLLSTDSAKSRAAIAKHSEADAAKWDAFTTRMFRLAGFLEALYVDAPPKLMSTQAGDMMHLMGLGLRLRRLGKVDMVELIRTLPMSLQDLLDDTFESDLLKASIAAAGVANLFQGPRSQGTSLAMLHHLVGRPAIRARWVAKDERGHLASVLAAAAKARGVTIKTGVAVAIDAADGKVDAITVDGQTVAAKIVVSGLDPRRTLFELASPTALDPEAVRAVKNVKARGIRGFVHLALGELPKIPGAPEGDAHAHLGAILGASAELDFLERAYDDAKHRRMPTRLHLEATIPSLFDPSLAPKGKHVMSVAVQWLPMEPDGKPWDASAKDALGHRVIEVLGAIAPNLPASVLAMHVTTPADLVARFGLTGGHLHQGDLTLDQFLFMRPMPGFAQYASPLAGLYLCGDCTHPGGALPGLAGANAAREILRALR